MSAIRRKHRYLCGHTVKPFKAEVNCEELTRCRLLKLFSGNITFQFTFGENS